MSAATTASLEALHAKLTEQMNRTLDRDMEDDLPTDAATMGVIKGFLKDNNITATPAEDEKLQRLKEVFSEQERIKQERKNKALHAVKERGEDYLTGT